MRDGVRYSIPGRRAFSLMELMVVLAVIAILMSLLMPSLIQVRRTTYRVLSANNQRSIGQGLKLWSGERRGRLPISRVLENDGAPDLGDLMRTYAPFTDDELADGGWAFGPSTASKRKVHGVDQRDWPMIGQGWDGLGHLFADGLVPDAEAFYCPAHWGAHPYERYEDEWIRPSSTHRLSPAGMIFGNYHYTGHRDLDSGRRLILERDPTRIIVTDGMRRRSDLNHRIGLNVLRADGAVVWRKHDTLLPLLPLETESNPSLMELNSVIRDVFSGDWGPESSGDG